MKSFKIWREMNVCSVVAYDPKAKDRPAIYGIPGGGTQKWYVGSPKPAKESKK